MNLNKHYKIFIIEDNNLFALTLKADLEFAIRVKNIDIFIFETGEASKEKFREIHPQIVILDYHLNSIVPEAANGIKILNWIKKENAETYVMMLSGEDDMDIALKSFKHGASDYIVKSETKVKKIIFSLFNAFKIIETRNDARKYKNLFAFITVIILFTAVILAIQLLEQ